MTDSDLDDIWRVEWIKTLVQAVGLGCLGLGVMLAAFATLAWKQDASGVITVGFALFVTLLAVVQLAYRLGKMQQSP